MQGALPCLGKEATTNDVQSLMKQDQYRTVRRVCVNTSNCDGYHKMLQSVRMQFLHSAPPRRGDRLPPIADASQRPASKSCRAPARFSAGLTFRAGNDGVPKEDAHELAHHPSLSMLEEDDRQRIAESEVWERHVLHQMMVVRYVTFVLREELDELEFAEREQRGAVAFEEEEERHWLQNESEASFQLGVYKEALLAKKEKERRLQESDALYPSPASGGAIHTPDAKSDARRILQQYVRLKHRSDSVVHCHLPDRESRSDMQSEPRSMSRQMSQSRSDRCRYSKGRLSVVSVHPVLRVQQSSNICNALGIAAYVGLMEKDTEGRRMLEQREEEDYADIMTLFREQMSLMLTWQHKRMHLERLLYWKGQREERQQKERRELELRALKPRDRRLSLRSELAMQETELRSVVSVEEEGHRAALEESYRDALVLVWARLLEVEERHACLNIVREEELDAQLHVQQLEMELRGAIVSEWRNNVLVVPEQIRLLEDLNRAWVMHGPQILTIQRAFRGWREKQLGWRYAHREIGRVIQERRDRMKISRGLNALSEFKMSLMTELATVQRELDVQRGLQQAELQEEEARKSAVICAEEGWEVGLLQRTSQRELVNDIILPRRRQCVEGEVDNRREIDVSEEFEWMRLTRVFSECAKIIDRKAELEKSEEAQRTVVEEEQQYGLSCLSNLEMDGRELLHITAMYNRLQQEEDRSSLASALLDEKQAQIDSMSIGLAAQYWKFVYTALDIEACDVSPRNVMFQEFVASGIRLFLEESLRFHQRLADKLIQSHLAVLCSTQIEVLSMNETDARNSILRLESLEWPSFREEAVRTLSADLRGLLHKIGAANRIKVFYRRYRAGKVGRSGLRLYLRETFRVAREKAQLENISNEQRSHVNHCRDLLRRAEEEQYFYTMKTIRMKMDVLVNKSEPRERDEIEKLEELMYSIMLRNDGLRRFSQDSDPITTLHQMESYERVSISLEWQMIFDHVLVHMKKRVTLDVMATKVQRHWKHFLLRRRRKAFFEVYSSAIVHEEMLSRMEIEVNELEDFFVCMVKPMECYCALWEYLHNDVPVFLQRMCFDIGYSVCIEEDEWRCRMLLLWRMRHSYHETSVEAEEAANRELLEKIEFSNGVQRVEVIDDESAVRDSLWNERVFFLLRMTLKSERERRVVTGLEYSRSVLQMEEGGQRKRISMDYKQGIDRLYCLNTEQLQCVGQEEDELEVPHTASGAGRNTTLNETGPLADNLRDPVQGDAVEPQETCADPSLCEAIQEQGPYGVGGDGSGGNLQTDAEGNTNVLELDEARGPVGGLPESAGSSVPVSSPSSAAVQEPNAVEGTGEGVGRDTASGARSACEDSNVSGSSQVDVDNVAQSVEVYLLREEQMECELTTPVKVVVSARVEYDGEAPDDSDTCVNVEPPEATSGVSAMDEEVNMEMEEL
ncbi:hypothetical protein ERJ75_001432100 [Trypanosoma vivax]|nr:hypothetical protein ERJ75_001432100 [Trypanosoma vivax]